MVVARRLKLVGEAGRRRLEAYMHPDKQRVNNPPVGLVTAKTDPTNGKKRYNYDPHLDPELVWAGKDERTAFEVPTVSLHVHERIDPRTILEAVRKRNGDGVPQLSLFESERREPLREAVQFYQHAHGWSNRLIAGDSLLVMNSLLEKEGMAGKVQMIYIDPPYGIKYGSNFQPFVNKRDVRDGKDEDLTAEPEQIRAFRDTWELGIHSYLTYLRDRLLLARELLAESGSIFVQIGDENVHHVRELLDEVFGKNNFLRLITWRSTMGSTDEFLPSITSYLLWYAKDKIQVKTNPLYGIREPGGEGATAYQWIELEDGTRRRLTSDELEGKVEMPRGRVFRIGSLYSQHPSETRTFEFEFHSKKYHPGASRQWATSREGLDRLEKVDRLIASGNTLGWVLYMDEVPIYPLTNVWTDTVRAGFAGKNIYVVQTNTKVVERCILMTTDPGDLVFDPTCGSGTTAYVAEQWGRRWITCDTSRVAIAIARQRLMTAVYDYYELAHPDEGVGSGFKYKTVPRITLKSIANNPEIETIHVRWQPRLDTVRSELNKLLGRAWEEWEIPREPAPDWPQRAKELLQEWWRLRRERQQEIDASIARHADTEVLYDQPIVDRSKIRVTGPFTVEAVPAPTVLSVDEASSVVTYPSDAEADASVARTGETIRQRQWRDELLKTGIRGKGGQRIEFARVEPLSGTRYLHAEAETKGDKPLRAVISFGPEHAPLEPRQVERALDEASHLRPTPDLVIFAAFQFDPEAAKDIEETNWPGVTLLKVQMNPDLLTEDLKKKRASNESYWLIGQPDVEFRRIEEGPHRGKWQVEVRGFDYFDTRTGQLISGGPHNIAMWMLDPDYDGRSLYPRQVFFPMAGEDGGWAKLARTLKAEIDEELIEHYRGTVSLPFELGQHRQVAVKIVDDRGVESLKVLKVDA